MGANYYLRVIFSFLQARTHEKELARLMKKMSIRKKLVKRN